jgi:hypothetical protein
MGVKSLLNSDYINEIINFDVLKKKLNNNSVPISP